MQVILANTDIHNNKIPLGGTLYQYYKFIFLGGIANAYLNPWLNVNDNNPYNSSEFLIRDMRNLGSAFAS